MNLQDTHFTYNDTFRRIRVTIFDIQKQYVFYILTVGLKYLLSYMHSATPQRRIIF